MPEIARNIIIAKEWKLNTPYSAPSVIDSTRLSAFPSWLCDLMGIDKVSNFIKSLF